jgi:glycosyltransferase involved in cell wall biosynthesis
VRESCNPASSPDAPERSSRKPHLLLPTLLTKTVPISARPTLVSVITLTYNTASTLPRLIASLRQQTDPDFEWVIADGGSNDGTLELLRGIDDIDIRITSEPDHGIYDALNRGVRASSGEYYVVIGADDFFEPDAIRNFRANVYDASGNPVDMVASAWTSQGKLFQPRKGMGWLYGMRGVASCHSVALLIRKGLHERFGYYSNDFTLCADQLFVKSVLYAGGTINRCSFISGNYSNAGTSAANPALWFTDFFRVQMLTEKNKLLQVCLLVLRLIKNFKKL